MNLKLEFYATKKINNLDYIRGLLRIHKITSRDVARRIGVHESLVCHVLADRAKSHRVQQAIAEDLKMSFEDLWGESA